MTFILQSVVLCAVFTAIVHFHFNKNPIQGIASYPASVRKRLQSLPQYQGTVYRKVRGHIFRKAIAVLFLVALLTTLIWYSTNHDFASAFLYSFGLFSAVNLWDLVVIDWIWACNSKRFRIPGTEDMVREYRDPWHHLRGFGMGTVIGLVVSLFTAGIVALISLFA